MEPMVKGVKAERPFELSYALVQCTSHEVRKKAKTNYQASYTNMFQVYTRLISPVVIGQKPIRTS